MKQFQDQCGSNLRSKSSNPARLNRRQLPLQVAESRDNIFFLNFETHPKLAVKAEKRTAQQNC
jgi:hypothetical protein